MDRYLTHIDCNSCRHFNSCFISELKTNINFLNYQKKHLSYKKGETIIKKGTDVSKVIFIISGLVKMYIEGPEKNIIIKLLNSQDFLGLTSLYGNDIYYYSVSALKETKLCIIEREHLRQLLSDCCDFSRRVAQWYCSNYNIMLTKCLNLGLKQSNGKLANILLYLNRDEFQEEDVFSWISRKDIAELSGMSAESVTRILAEFSNEGIVRLSGKRIDVIDIEKLNVINKNG